MYVYIWKYQFGPPFYVGCTGRLHRVNPRNNGNRNWLCKARIAKVGVENIRKQYWARKKAIVSM